MLMDFFFLLLLSKLETADGASYSLNSAAHTQNKKKQQQKNGDQPKKHCVVYLPLTLWRFILSQTVMNKVNDY